MMNLYVKLRKVYFGTHPCHAPIILILNAEVSFASDSLHWLLSQIATCRSDNHYC